MGNTQRKLQATATINIALPLIKKDGSQASGLALNTLSSKIIKPDGTALAGYTEAIFTEPNGDGVYNVQFPLNAAVKAFTLEDQANPYTLTFDSSTADVEPTCIEVWIVSRLPYELSRPSDILNDPATDKLDGSNMAKETTSQSILIKVSATYGSGNTAVDHNTAGNGSVVADSMRVLYNGLPVDGAVIEVYQCTLANYNLGVRGTVKAKSETKADGRWIRPVYIDGGLTYTVVIYKQGAFAPLATEVILP